MPNNPSLFIKIESIRSLIFNVHLIMLSNKIGKRKIVKVKEF